MYVCMYICANYNCLVGLVLIRGESSDGTGADSNGSGKVLLLYSYVKHTYIHTNKQNHLLL